MSIVILGQWIGYVVASAAPAPSAANPITFWVELVVHAGVLGAIAVFLIRHMAARDGRQSNDNKEMIDKILRAAEERETRMADRIDKLEDDNKQLQQLVRDQLASLIERAAVSTTENTVVMKELAALAKEQHIEIKALREVLLVRPCFAEEVRKHILEQVEEQLQQLAKDANGKE